MDFTPWPKIPSLRNFIKTGDTSVLQYTLILSVKIHGTNAAIGMDGENVWCQSRSRIITPANDNHGFAAWIEGKKDWLLERYHRLKLKGEVIIFGEFAGKGIQQKVGVSEMEPFFYIFPGQPGSFACDSQRFFSHFQVFAGLDEWEPNRLATLEERLEKVVAKIDQRCPFYEKMTGKGGVGEGIVVYDAHCQPLFKVKGDSHKTVEKAVTQPKGLDELTLKELTFADAERLNQIYLSYGGGRELQPQEIPDYIRAVIVDIESEEGAISTKGKKVIGNKAAMFLKEKLV